jgi:hypothetical protein
MVDSNARRCAADLVAKLRDGLITNREFEGSWPQSDTEDRGLLAVETMLWHYYDDFRTHKLTGRHALESSDRELFDRCVQFLRTDLEYEWTEGNFIVTGRDFANSVGRLDLNGDDPCWPFTRGQQRSNR